jgi:hypothetical protein
MRDYILKRLLQIIPTVLMITLGVFAMMQTIPGVPIIALPGDVYSEEDAMQLHQAYGLDTPLMVQYVIWLGKLVRGDVDSQWSLSAPGRAHASAGNAGVHCPRYGSSITHCYSRRHSGGIAPEHLDRLHGHDLHPGRYFYPRFFPGILLLLVFSFALQGLLPNSGWVYWPK